MKLALCLFKYFPYGGLQRNFVAVASVLIERGHDVVVYTGAWEGARVEGLNVELLPVMGITNYGKNKHFYKLLVKALRDNPVDLVVGFNKMPGLDIYYCADTCFATKVHEHKTVFFRLNPRARWALSYEQAVFGRDKKTEILLLSVNEGHAFQKYYSTAQQRMHLMPPGISKSRVRNDSSDVVGRTIRLQLGVADNEKLVAFLGSDYKRKGLDRLLLAVASLSDKEKLVTKVLVIGRDKRIAKYQHMVIKLGIESNIIFVGQRDDVPALLFACDCLAHPAYLENTGNVLLEAVVAGLPVLCTDVCGYAFYISENRLGYVVPSPFKQSVMNTMFGYLLNCDAQDKGRCVEFAKVADIYSRPQCIAETIETIGEKQCR